MKERTMLIVLCTVPDPEVGAKMGRALVEERLAACVNIIPGLRSIFHWQGNVDDDSEALLLIKSSQGLLAEMTERIKQLHPYDVPEVLGLQIVGGLGDYLAWMHDELKEEPGA